MIAFLLAAALATQAAPAAPSDQHKDHAQHEGMKHGDMKHEGDCCGPDKACCKGDKPMPCCQKAAEQKKAEAPAAESHGGHEHAH